mgnify:FL=1
MWRDIVPPHFINRKVEMTNFTVKIWAYDHYASFDVKAEDSPKSIENSILDKIGEKSISWEYLGNSYDNNTNRITYEEVNHDRRPIQTKKVLGVEVATGV